MPISAVSCTLTTSAPPCTAAATVAAVPHVRCAGSVTPVIFPTKALRLEPTSHGRPSSPGQYRSSSSLRNISMFCSPVLAKPIPGSRIIRHRRIPASSAAATRERSSDARVGIRPSGYEVNFVMAGNGREHVWVEHSGGYVVDNISAAGDGLLRDGRTICVDADSHLTSFWDRADELNGGHNTSCFFLSRNLWPARSSRLAANIDNRSSVLDHIHDGLCEVIPVMTAPV
ncbi:hypothetical protein HG531_010398 [Fusarium graminearum]|nr:hypothetical protein HG531_010398 [Fusarium graminearum]